VRNALDDVRAELPTGAGVPEFRNEATDTFTVISALMPAEGAAADPVLLSRLADELADRLRGLPGTKKVQVYGVADEEILVEIDPARLAVLGIGTAEVAAAIAAADAKIPGGSIAGPERDLAVEIAGEIGDLARVRAIPLRTGADGALLRVGDLAAISRTPREPPASLARVEGGPAVLVAARMEADLQVEPWAAHARDALTTVLRLRADGAAAGAGRGLRWFDRQVGDRDAGHILRARPRRDAGRLLPAGDGRSEGGLRFPRLGAAFARSIDLSLANPGLSILAALVLPITGFPSRPSRRSSSPAPTATSSTSSSLSQAAPRSGRPRPRAPSLTRCCGRRKASPASSGSSARTRPPSTTT
jgi:hypothetical protein